METLMQQATQVFFDGLRKQSFSVVLTLAGLVALGWWNLRERSECQSSIAALEIEMDSCTSQRLSMAIEVARLRERVNVLAEKSVRKR
jgi:hypothetical protein